MKAIIFCLSLLGSVSAFANPFANFVGSYKPISSPQVAMAGMSYCNWQGFREITGLTISLQSGLYVADLSSKVNNSPMHSYTTFEEYSYAGDWGVKNIAKIVGGSQSADYQIVNSSTGSMEAYHWVISKPGSSYHLRMSYQVSNGGSSVSSCVYDVDLAKQ